MSKLLVSLMDRIHKLSINITQNFFLKCLKTFFVLLLEPTVFVISPPSTRIVNDNETVVVLPCSARSDVSTDVELTWYKGANTLKALGNDRLSIDEHYNLTIDFDGLDLEEKTDLQGDYRCEASNGYSIVRNIRASLKSSIY